MPNGWGGFVNRQGAAQGNWNDWAMVLISLLLLALGIPTVVFAGKYPERTIAWLGDNPETEVCFDGKLREIVTAPYNPKIPNGRDYVLRQQDAELMKDLHANIASETNFFLLMGESGSGKTTMMQHLLKENFTEGVIFVAVNADKLVDVPKNKVRGVVEAAVLDQFGECKNPRRYPELRGVRTDFARLEVNAMTETEFLAIGKQLLAVKDPQNLTEPYLKYYHDWLGGQAKTLMGFVGDKAGSASVHRFVAFLYNMIINHTSHRS